LVGSLGTLLFEELLLTEENDADGASRKRLRTSEQLPFSDTSFLLNFCMQAGLQLMNMKDINTEVK
jgi:hypothetical protein